MNYFSETRGGFTLIELIVVIAIIGFFSSFLLINFRSNQKTSEVRQQALLVVDMIKTAQTMALSGQTIKDAQGNDVKPDVYTAAAGCPLPSTCLAAVIPGDLQSGQDATKFIILPNSIQFIGDIRVFSFSGSRASLKISTVDANGEYEQPETTMRLQNIDNPLINQCITVNALSGRVDLVNCQP